MTPILCPNGNENCVRADGRYLNFYPCAECLGDVIARMAAKNSFTGEDPPTVQAHRIGPGPIPNSITGEGYDRRYFEARAYREEYER